METIEDGLAPAKGVGSGLVLGVLAWVLIVGITALVVAW